MTKTINIVRKKENPELFKEMLGLCEQEHSSKRHRRGSNFFVKSLVRVEPLERSENIGEEYIGIWETNEYIASDEDTDWDEITTFTRVELKEETVVVKKWVPVIMLLLMVMLFSGCSENYSNGERIGMIQKFSKSGVIYKSWEGDLHVTQTGMSSNTDFSFSLDNDNEPEGLAAKIDSAAQHGWLVKLTYHETVGKNWFSNRGSTDHFVTKMQLLNKNPMQTAFSGNKQDSMRVKGKTIDTIYVVILRNK